MNFSHGKQTLKTDVRREMHFFFFLLLQCAHMKYFFLVKINALSVLEMMSQFEVKPKKIKCNRYLTGLKIQKTAETRTSALDIAL